MIPIDDFVYMILIQTTHGIWVWLTIALGNIVGEDFWSPNTGLIYTFQQLFGR